MISRHLFGSRLAAFAVVLTVAAIPLSAMAANDTWVGGGSNTFWNNGTNWLSGAPPVTGVDALIFGGANTANQNNFTGATFTGISFAGGASSFNLNGNSLHLGFQTTGTGITHSGDIVNNSSSLQTISLPVTIDPGKHVITAGAGGLNLSGVITRSNGSAVIFNPGAGAINLTGSGLTTSNGILGGWATIGQNWATLDGSGNVVPYSSYTDVVPTGTIASNAASNVRIPNAGAAISIAAGTTSINSLLFSGSTAAQTVNVGAGNKIVLGKNGGIFNATGVAGGSTLRNLTIGAAAASGGTLTAGDGVSPATINIAVSPFYTNAGGITINSQITDNGSAPVSVVLMGGYSTLLNNVANQTNGLNNTYSGGTYVLSGRISQPVGGTFGTGPVYIFPGGMVNPGGGVNVTIPNNLFIAGNGTFENNGLGAIRMFNTANFTTQLTGTLTLMADASICSNGLTAAQITGNRHVAVVGKITGPGGLGIGSAVTNSANGSGFVEIGALTGTAVANDYAGDTSINGATGGAVNAGLSIGAPTDNNIMPHGLTGSFAGGPTGNVVLNANAATRQAIFDLNGSTQTINGLTNTGTSVANNIVQSRTPGGVLILGDSNVTAAFGGVMQDGGGGLAVTKVGSGVQTLSGANTYTGNTTISAGAISATGSLAITGNVAVNTSASAAGSLYGAGDGVATGVVGNVTLQAANGSNKAVINPGAAGRGSVGTLTMSSLTVGAGSDLQFDAFGAGSADQIHVTGATNFTGASTINPTATTPGTYTLLQADGGITGTTPTIGAGDSRLTYFPAIGLNSIAVTASGNVANLQWTGGLNGNVWDLKNTQNWTNTLLAVQDKFFAGDNVTFGNSANTNVTINGAVAPGSTTFTNSSGTYVFSGGSIAGAGSLTLNGAGSVTLTANNTYSGGTVLNGGTLNVNSAGALGTGGITFVGGVLGNTSGKSVTVSSNPAQTWAANITFSGPSDLNLGTGAVTQTGLGAGGNVTVTVNLGTLTVGGVIPDSAGGGNGLIKAGNGTLALNGVNTFTGVVTVSAGILKVGSFGALGTAANAPAGHVVLSGATLDIGGITTMNAAGGFAAPITISGFGVNGQGAIVNTGLVGQQNAFQVINLAANASVGGDGTGTPVGPNFIGRFDIRGGLAQLNLNGFTLTKTGTNQFSLVGATVSNGSLVVNQGILSLEGGTSIVDNSDGTSVTVNPNATLQFVTPSGTITRPIVLNSGIVNDGSTGASAVAANITLQGNSTFTGPNNSNMTLSGTISGATGALTKAGVNTITLTGTNNYGGGTNFNGGIVNFSALANLGTGPLSFNGGTLQYSSNTDDVSVRTITLNFSGGTIDVAGNTVSFANGIGNGGAGGLTKEGSGTLTLNGASSYQGTTTVGNGTLVLGAAGALPTGRGLAFGDPANSNGILDLNGRSITVSSITNIGTGTSSQIGSGSATPGNMTVTYAGNATAPSAFNGTIQDTVNSGAGQVVSLAVTSGKLTLNGFNTYSGATSISGGGTLALGTNGNIAGSTPSPLNLGGGTFAVTGSTSPSLGNLTMTSSSTLDFGTNSSTMTFSSASPTWTGTLTVSNWSGQLTGSGTDQLRIGANSSSLTATQIAAIKFDGYPFGSQFVTGTNEIVPSHTGYVQGDWNKSGALDEGDLTTMLSALTDLNAFATANGYTQGDLRVIGDIDGNGAVTNADIQREINLLANLGLGSVSSVPEPATIALLALGGAGLMLLRRKTMRG